MRLCGHGEHDVADYVDAKLKNSLIGRDCLKVGEEYLLQQNWTSNTELAAWRSEAAQKVDEAVAKVQREPAPDPFAEDWTSLSSKHLTELHDEESPGPADI